MHGYVCLVFRRHVVELHDLSESEGLTFMRDMRKVSRALSLVTGAIKLNYEIHGNSIPHLHVHFFPRHVGDAFENQPINPKAVVGPVYAPGEYNEFRKRLVQALTSGGA